MPGALVSLAGAETPMICGGLAACLHYHRPMYTLPFFCKPGIWKFRSICGFALTLCLYGCLGTRYQPDSANMHPNSQNTEPSRIRIATFNIAMGFEQAGEMTSALQNPQHQRLQQIAAILQTVRPDIVLLNEFDYDPTVDVAKLLHKNFLADGREGRQAIDYPYHFRAPSNTGLGSGLDIDGDGIVEGPADAWGFGHFSGQYGMLLLSRYPIPFPEVRTFQYFLWASMAGAHRPMKADGSNFYSDDTWQKLRLSSKSHWDVPVQLGNISLHILASHPTPPVFDGPENRNGLRNFDEIRFWAEYLRPEISTEWQDDEGRTGGLPLEDHFVILGDLNADPSNGDSLPGASQQLLEHERINNRFTPLSRGAAEASQLQGGLNTKQTGNPAADTADFNDQYTGNLRIDYVLPSSGLEVVDGAVFWPASQQPGHEWMGVSDHHLVWLDLQIAAKP